MICIKARSAEKGHSKGVDSSNKTVTLDVREEIKSGREPFGKIMAAVAKLRPDEDLLLLAPFEPVPLYSVLGARGYSATARPLESGDYEVRFSPEGSSSASAPGTGSTAKVRNSTPVIVEVDTRGLEPPQPLVKILEAVAALPKGAQLRAITDRRPMHLYPQLVERGFSGQTDEQPDGSYVTYVRPL